ncbi:uncharacterized protein LOC127753898 [Oryza glaberrima]|uniref:DUF7866 domain-containing protein n=1 Tax=Oryza glaberrima TaxID=4538 RepID=I1R013_ORYGL|nr:uncharacterized protein LOC127753898 [Oryza glaberrima]XP_052135307.1 uncharacterized protein LOC127753898 [Oryza glaberrima]
MASSSSPPLLLLVSLLAAVAATFLAAQALAQHQPQGNATAAAGEGWRPRLRKTYVEGGAAGMVPRRRRLVGRFQICAVCTCCGGPHGVCIPAPCCYAINCNIPNRPFGVCSFTPRTCNCLNCHL